MYKDTKKFQVEFLKGMLSSDSVVCDEMAVTAQYEDNPR
jgi:hypothetical protein